MSEQGSEPATPGAGPDAASLQRQVADLKTKVEVLRQLQARARRQSVIVGLIVLVTIAIWVITTRSRIEQNFSDQQVTEAVEHEARPLTELLIPHLRRVMLDVGPDVRRQAMDRLQKVAPALADRAYVRLSLMPQTAGQIVMDAMATAFERAASRAEPELANSAGQLSDATRRDLLLTHFHQQVADYSPQIAQHTQALFSGQAAQFRLLLAKFDLPDAQEPVDLDGVERDFLHHLLSVLDENMQRGGGADEIGEKPSPAGTVP